MNDADQQVGFRIRGRRRVLRLTMQQVAEALGVSPPQYRRYELGMNRVPVGTLYRLSEILSVPPDYFLEAASDHASPPLSADLAGVVDNDEGQQLNVAFARVRSAHVRHAIIMLVKTIAERGNAMAVEGVQE